jgi:hypothetical protein
METHKVYNREEEVLVHRKGATRAFGPGREEVPLKYREVGQPVLIPGTMGTASYVLCGTEKAMEETFGSTAHGAGRILSRSKAKKDYDADEITSDLNSRGIQIRATSKHVIEEEAPGAYKDVDSVVRVSDSTGIAKLVAKVNNNYIVGLIFFVIPFVLTQFMSNRGAMLIFIPIAIATCHKVGGDPRGLIILIQAAALTAFMTPMATAAVPYMMEYGGYDQKDMFKGGWLFAIIGCVISVGWIMTVLPVLCSHHKTIKHNDRPCLITGAVSKTGGRRYGTQVSPSLQANSHWKRLVPQPHVLHPHVRNRHRA